MSILLPSLAYCVVLIAAFFRERLQASRIETAQSTSSPRLQGQWLSQTLVLILLIIHGMALQEAIFSPKGFVFGFSYALSMMAWVGVAFYWIENWFFHLRGMLFLVLVMAMLCSFSPVVFPGAVLSDRAVHSHWFKLHFFVANAAYGLMSLAALHAILMGWQDRQLRHQAQKKEASWIEGLLFSGSAWLDKLPPLMTMEKVLFNLLRVGFALLTLTVFSGVFFSQTLFGRPLIFDHKTIFALASWLMFGGLLLARWRTGMRGVQALRWVLGSFIVLMFAYIGSRFVLEVLLQRAL
jgi:ABC-type uncharacterized transport system permease subunit